MDGDCSTHGRYEKCIELGDNTLVDLREIWREFVEWMHLAQDSDQWQALVNMVMNLRVP
jgi:hypothetical protein